MPFVIGLRWRTPCKPLRIALLAGASFAGFFLAASGPACAQAIYTGAITTPITLNSGTATIVSGTTVTLPSGTAVNVNAGQMTIGDTSGTVSLTTNGDVVGGSNALRAGGGTAVVTATGLTAITSGLSSDTVVAIGGGQISLTGGTVTYTKTNTAPDQNASVVADGTTSFLTATNVMINVNNASAATTNTFAFGAASRTGGHTVINGGTITGNSSTTNTRPHVYGANAGGGIVDLNNVVIKTTGLTSHGVVAAGGTANVNGGTVTTVSSGSAGLYSSGSGGNSVVNATGTVVNAAAGNGVMVEVATGTDANTVVANVYNITATAGANGLNASGATRQINAVSSTIKSASTGAYAISAGTIRLQGGFSPDGGTTILGGTSITTTGSSAYGAMASGAGSLVDASDPAASAIVTAGTSAHGGYAVSSGKVLFTNDSIATAGSTAYGVYAASSGILNATDTTILTQGLNANGAYGRSKGSVTILRGSITTQKDGARGLAVGDTGTTMTDTNTAIVTAGVNAYGANAFSAGTLFVTGGSIATSGVGAHGVVAQDLGSTVNISGTKVTTTGVAGHGAAVFDGAILNAGGVTINATNGSGVYMETATANRGTANFTAASSIISGAAPTIAMASGVNTINLTDTTVKGNQNWLRAAPTGTFTAMDGVVFVAAPPLPPTPVPPDLTDVAPDPAQDPDVIAVSAASGPATATINATNSQITGAAFTDTGSTSTVTLVNSIWNMTGSSNVTTLTNDPSLIVFTPPAAGADLTNPASYKTLTAVNYIGQGGAVVMNTYLGDDTSPSDRMIINGGSATGATTLFIRRAGGPGALTVGNGIEVVSAVNNATTAPGAFALGNMVAAGPYEYLLFRGGITSGTENNWFLRDVLGPVPPAPPAPPAPPGPTPPEPIPPGPPSPTPPTPPTPTPEPTPTPTPQPAPQPLPIFRPAAALYITAAPAARETTILTLGTFHERQGDQWLLEQPNNPESAHNMETLFDGSLQPAFWGRGLITAFTRDGSGPLQAEFSGHVTGMQVGLDIAHFQTLAGDSDRVGLFYGYSSLSADGHAFVLGLQDTLYGSLSLTTQNAGAYWTHIGQNGWYGDAVIMESFYSATPVAPQDVVSDLSGHAITGSLEGGYPWQIADTIELETQGQVIFQSLDFDPASDAFTSVAFDSDMVVTGRLGLQLQDNLNIDKMWIQPRILFNLWHTFAGNDTTIYNGVIPIAAPFEQTTAEMGAGAAARLLDQLSAYTQVTYTTNLGGAYVQRVKATLGARIAW